MTGMRDGFKVMKSTNWLQDQERRKPQEGKQYLLIGGGDKPSIVNGNNWEESEVKQMRIIKTDCTPEEVQQDCRSYKG